MKHERIWLCEKNVYPYVDTYLLNEPRGDEGDNKKRGLVIVLPGGAYHDLASHEGEPVAMKFAAAGYHSAVLYYRRKTGKHTDPLEDVARTIRLIREHADEWLVDRDNISVCGFSTGGHLAASIGVFWDKPFLSELCGAPNEDFRPNGLILGYPVITALGEFAHEGSFQNLAGGDESLRKWASLEQQVSRNTPPTFLWHTADDSGVVAENSLMFAMALSAHKIPYELHIYPHGKHGQPIAEDHIVSYRPSGFNNDCADGTRQVICWLEKN